MSRAATASVHRGPFDVDEERALDALRVTWSGSYTVAFDDAPGAGRPRWRAWPLGHSKTTLTGATPDELDRAIRAHCQAAQ